MLVPTDAHELRRKISILKNNIAVFQRRRADPAYAKVRDSLLLDIEHALAHKQKCEEALEKLLLTSDDQQVS